ncbi:four-carbon acid sugar kinase family protein, partial [Rhizobium ruizarguesonis]
LNPMHDANLVRVLTRQSRNVVGLIDLTTIAAGPGAVKARPRPDAPVDTGVSRATSPSVSRSRSKIASAITEVMPAVR